MMIDRDALRTCAVDAPAKEASPSMAKAVCDVAKMLGHRELEFRTDGEPAMEALQEKVALLDKADEAKECTNKWRDFFMTKLHNYTRSAEAWVVFFSKKGKNISENLNEKT